MQLVLKDADITGSSSCFYLELKCVAFFRFHDSEGIGEIWLSFVHTPVLHKMKNNEFHFKLDVVSFGAWTSGFI